MRKTLLLRSAFALMSLALHSALLAAPMPPPLEPVISPNDSVKRRAAKLLEQNLDYLRNLYQFQGKFTREYDGNAQIHCDICPVKGPKAVLDYVYEVTNRFPDGFNFVHEIPVDKIELTREDVGQYRVTVKFKKLVPKVNKDGIVPGKTERVELVAEMYLDYNKVGQGQWFDIKSISIDAPPSENLAMVEAIGMKALGSPAAAALDPLNVSFGSSALTLGFAYYFAPTSGLKHQNIWLRAGLRGGARWGSVRNGNKLETSEVQLLDPHPAPNEDVDLHHYLIRIQDVRDIKETVTSYVLEVPLGISKRWHWDKWRYVDFGLELEFGAGMELARRVKREYTMRQAGYQVFTWGDDGIDGMSESGGGLLLYENYEVVRDQGRTDITLFPNSTDIPSPYSSQPRPYLFWSLNPSIFLRDHNDEIKYQIGLRFAMLGMKRATDTLDSEYFLRNHGDDRAALTTLIEPSMRFFVGFNVGMRIR